MPKPKAKKSKVTFTAEEQHNQEEQYKQEQQEILQHRHSLISTLQQRIREQPLSSWLDFYNIIQTTVPKELFSEYTEKEWFGLTMFFYCQNSLVKIQQQLDSISKAQ